MNGGLLLSPLKLSPFSFLSLSSNPGGGSLLNLENRREMGVRVGEGCWGVRMESSRKYVRWGTDERRFANYKAF